MNVQTKLVLSLCVALGISLSATGCASKRTTATGGTAPAGTTTTADGVVHGKPNTDNSGNVTPDTSKDAAARLEASTSVFNEIMAVPDKGIPQSLLDKAHCVIVVPGLKKGAFVVGAQYGKGYFSCRKQGGAGWTAPAAVRVEGGSVGFQIGGEETDVVMLVMNPKGEDRLLSSQFTLGGDASVAAGPVGRFAEASTDAYMTAEILSWSRSRGVFAGVSLQGATLREDMDDNEALYGRRLTNRDIIQGKVPVPPAAKQFVATLAKYSPKEAGGGA